MRPRAGEPGRVARGRCGLSGTLAEGHRDARGGPVGDGGAAGGEGHTRRGAHRGLWRLRHGRAHLGGRALPGALELHAEPHRRPADPAEGIQPAGALRARPLRRGRRPAHHGRLRYLQPAGGGPGQRARDGGRRDGPPHPARGPAGRGRRRPRPEAVGPRRPAGRGRRGLEVRLGRRPRARGPGG